MWDFGVLTASYLYNRNPTPLLQGRSPLEVMFNRTLEYTKLRVFDCKCFPCLCPYRANKLDVKLLQCIFVGYSIQHDAYLCLDPATRRIFTSRDVVFDEQDFSLNASLYEGTSCKEPWKLSSVNFGDRVNSSGLCQLPDKIPPAIVSTSPPTLVSPLSTSPDLGPDSDNVIRVFDTQIRNLNSLAVHDSLANEFPVVDQTDSEAESSNNLGTLTQKITRGYNGIVKPNPKYALTVSASEVFVPRSHKTALSKLEWKSAMEAEILVL